MVYIDYQPGQLRSSYEKYIPSEVRSHLDKTAVIVKKKLVDFYEIYQEQRKEGVKIARQWIKGIKIGDNDLEELLFHEEIHEEKLDTARKAAEKIKEAVEKMNKMASEKQGKEEDDLRQAEAVAQKLKAERDARLAKEAEVKAKEELRIKAEKKQS